MASTSVHLPPALVEALDRLAEARGSSRNRIIVEACERLLAEERGEWPAGFFGADLPPRDLELLRDASLEMEAAIYASRRDRPVRPL